MEGPAVKKGIFLLLFLALFVLVARLFYPFLTIILWSGLLYVVLVPLYDRITRRRGTKPMRPVPSHIWAGLLSVLGVLIIVVPLAFLAVKVTRQVGELTSATMRAIERHPEFLDLSPSGTLGGFVSRITNGDVDLSSVDLRGDLSRVLAGSAQRIIGASGTILKGVATFAITLAFMVFTLYFFFVDGRQLVHVLVGAIPIEKEHTRLFIRTLRDTSKQLVLGYLLVALYQSAAAFVIFTLFHVKGPLVLALFTAITSFIPMVGASLVWAPVGIARIVAGDLSGGIAILVASAFFVSTMDNFLRPLFLRGRLNIHPLLIFFSILGGLTLFGFNGIILGPLILILFFTAVGVYDGIYRQAEVEEEPDKERE
jgi:predicted PurR-regulated permease PerM